MKHFTFDPCSASRVLCQCECLQGSTCDRVCRWCSWRQDLRLGLPEDCFCLTWRPFVCSQFCRQTWRYLYERRKFRRRQCVRHRVPRVPLWDSAHSAGTSSLSELPGIRALNQILWRCTELLAHKFGPLSYRSCDRPCTRWPVQDRPRSIRYLWLTVKWFVQRCEEFSNSATRSHMQ